MNKNTEVQVSSPVTLSSTSKKGKPHYLIDVLIIVVMGMLLFMGSWAQTLCDYSDAARYQCYAIAFLHNVLFAKSALPSQCGFIFGSPLQTYTNAQIVTLLHGYGAPTFLVDFVASQDLSQPFHSLPHEYPALTLVPFLLVLFAPGHWYQVAFAILMISLAAGIYLLLVRFKSRRVGVFGAILLVVGGWATVAGRFDLIPSFLTLLAVLLAEQKRWTWAFVALAVAFLMKLYPVILLIPFLVGPADGYAYKMVCVAAVATVCGVYRNMCVGNDGFFPLKCRGYHCTTQLLSNASNPGRIFWIISHLALDLCAVPSHDL